MGKQQKYKRQRREYLRETHLVIVKAVHTGADGIAIPDYQMLRVEKSQTLEKVRDEILAHVSRGHPEFSWTVETFDPDDMPPDAVPSGTGFSVPIR